MSRPEARAHVDVSARAAEDSLRTSLAAVVSLFEAAAPGSS